MKWMGVWVGVAVLTGCATTGQTQRTEDNFGTPKEQQAAAMSHYLSSVVHQKLGQAPEAIDELRRAADLAPESTRLVIQLLGAYYVNEDYENAALMAERAVKADPNSVVLRVW